MIRICSSAPACYDADSLMRFRSQVVCFLKYTAASTNTPALMRPDAEGVFSHLQSYDTNGRATLCLVRSTPLLFCRSKCVEARGNCHG